MVEAIAEWIDEGARVLQKGGIILYPTDTIWGIGCDARRATAVARVFALKGRNDGKALLALVDSESMLNQHVGLIPPAALRMHRDLSRPTTVVYGHAVGIADNLRGMDGSMGFRLVHHAVCAGLIRQLGGPLVSTSANRSGHPFDGTFDDISPEILSGVDWIYPGARVRPHNEKVKPSRVVRINTDGLGITVLRD